MKGFRIFFVSLAVVIGLSLAPKSSAQAGDAEPAGNGEQASPSQDASESPDSGHGAQGKEGKPHANEGHDLPKALTLPLSLLAGVSVIGISGLSVFAFLLLTLIAFPGTVERVREGLETRPWFASGLGLVNVVFVMFLVGALANAGPAGGILGFLIFLAFLGLVVFGLSGRAQALGARAMVLADHKPNSVLNLAIGWWVLFLVGIIPFVGWVLFAYWAVNGVGAVLVTLFGRARKPSVPEEGGGIVISKPDFTV